VSARLRATPLLIAAAAVVWLLGEELGRPSERLPHVEPSDDVAAEAPIRISRIDVPAPPEPEPRREVEPERAPEPERVEVREEAADPEPPPPAPEPAPVEPASDAASDAAPAPVDPAAVLARGHALLEAGRFPRLRASYERIGFAAYRDAMLALGAGFYLFDGAQRRPVVQVDPRTGREVGGAPIELAALSHWPRDVTRHLPSTLARGRRLHGERVSRVILLPPAAIDATLLGTLARELEGLSLDPGELVRVDVAYELRDGKLACEVLALGLRDGSDRGVSFYVDLEAGTRA